MVRVWGAPWWRVPAEFWGALYCCLRHGDCQVQDRPCRLLPSCLSTRDGETEGQEREIAPPTERSSTKPSEPHGYPGPSSAFLNTISQGPLTAATCRAAPQIHCCHRQPQSLSPTHSRWRETRPTARPQIRVRGCSLQRVPHQCPEFRRHRDGWQCAVLGLHVSDRTVMSTQTLGRRSLGTPAS